MIVTRVHLAQAPLALTTVAAELARAVAWPPTDFAVAWRAWFGAKTVTMDDMRAPSIAFVRALVVAYGDDAAVTRKVLHQLPGDATATATTAGRTRSSTAPYPFSPSLHLERNPRNGRVCVCNGASPRCCAPRDRRAAARARATAVARMVDAVVYDAGGGGGGGAGYAGGHDGDDSDYDDGGGGWRTLGP